ncbi:MAG TPA: hydantoinase/oxoprolinase family protein [Solirubrobacterales bacterium]|nr:hydantoinase/oxoprolinase family protein [Solirubrobacterales bacterium]
MQAITIDIDTGGTFTDAFVVRDGHPHRVKVLTTPHDFALCFSQVIERAAEVLDLDTAELLRETACIRYATTVGTNTVIERTGPRIGLIVDPESAAGGVPEGAFVEPEMVTAVAPGDGDGAVVEVAKELMARSARGLVCAMPSDADGAEAERAVLRGFHQHYPRHCLDAVPLTLSHEIAPDPDDARRTATALFNAYVHEDVAHYLYRAEDWLRDHGYTRPLLVVHNDGGCARVAKTVAGRTYNSGPTAGLLGAEAIAALCGIDHLLTFDVGGTSLDVGFLGEGRAHFKEHGRVTGVEVSFSMPDIQVLGAGGGSIAHVDDGVLAVGPQSAGANPGPACFGLGGSEATVTDADVVLGIIDAKDFLGGRMELHADAATAAVGRIAERLGISTVEAAAQIRSTLHDRMAERIGAELTERGLDPARTTMLAYGGGGPTHAAPVAARIGIGTVVTLPFGAVFSAFGASSADVRHVYFAVPGSDAEELLRRTALLDMGGEGFAPEQVEIELDRVHRHGAERLRLTAVAKLDHPALEAGAAEGHEPEPSGSREIHWPGEGTVPTPVHDAAELRPGAVVSGPAVLEAEDTTYVVPRGWTHRVDGHGIGWMTRTAKEES